MGDLLWRHLCDLPAFRALLRSVEARFYEDLALPSPVLDLGCGDGHFGSVALDGHVTAGFDPWRPPLQEARLRGAYCTLAQAVGSRMPFSDRHFGTVVSNSVLEHIVAVQPVLDEVARVLKPGGWFYFCVPGPSFTRFLSVGRVLDRLGCGQMANAYRRFFNRVSRHHHCDGVAVWSRRLDAAGFNLERWWAYFSRRALTALEWGHYLGLPSLVTKNMTGRWVLWPSEANLWVTERLVRPLYEEPLSQPPADRGPPAEGRAESEGAYLFFVARKPGIAGYQRGHGQE